jgi:Family of unknown function (DUF6599)
MTMKLNPRGLILAAICLAVLAVAACDRRAGRAAAPFPSSNEVAGWVKSGETRTFSATELWSYIDGDAERYVKAGVKSTATSDYNFKNTFDTVVDIYTMADAKGARTIFDGEPAAQAKSVPLGDAARQSGTSLVFYKGPYLVRLVAYKESPEGQAALKDLGREIERRLSR